MSSASSPLSIGATWGLGAAHAVAAPPGHTHPLPEEDVRREERSRERARIMHELHDTLLQGFLGASMVLDVAVEQTPLDSPSRPALSRALRLMHRAIDEGRAALRGVHMASTARSLEQAFANFLKDARSSPGAGLRIFVEGRPRTLNPAVQEQLFLIGREAVTNALRHSRATKIEVEVQYLRALLQVVVRDNGCGICAEAVQKASDSHWGLRGMSTRARSVGAQFGISSGRGAGTEIHVAIPIHLAIASGEC